MDGLQEPVRYKSNLLFGLENARLAFPLVFQEIGSFGHSKESKVAARAKYQIKNDQVDWMSADEPNSKQTISKQKQCIPTRSMGTRIMSKHAD